MANIKIEGTWKRILMHRFILHSPPGVKTDHKDGNGLNNQRSNIRFASDSQNAQNKTKHSNRHGRFKGVTWNANAGKWMAQIMAKRIYYYLGLFSHEEEAAKVYDRAAKELHGEFAKTNFP